jgi:hypothetical protein
MAGPVYAGNSGTPVFSGSNAVTVSVPSGIANGDLMIAQLWETTQTAAAPTNGAWTQAFSIAGSDHQLYILYRYASSEPANYTFTSTNATATYGWIHRITGAVTSGNPFNVIGSGNTANGATSLTTSAVTTTVANTLDMCFVNHDDGSNAISTYQSGWTGVSFSGTATVACSWIAQATAGTSGSATTTFTGNDSFTGVIGAIAAPVSSFTLTAASGTYSYTGEAATLSQGTNVFTLMAAPGDYSYVGAPSNSGFQVDAANGVYSINGQSAALSPGTFLLTATSGTYSYTGQNANLFQGINYILSASAGIYSLVGQAVAFAIGGGSTTVCCLPPTNLDIITFAYQKIGVIDENSPPSFEQGKVGLVVLNDYLLNQAADGMRLGWYSQSNISAQAPLRAEDIHGVKLLLARQLAAHYGITIQNPLLLDDIQKAETQLTKRSIRYAELDFSELSRPQGGPWGGPNWI